MSSNAYQMQTSGNLWHIFAANMYIPLESDYVSHNFQYSTLEM